MEVSVFNVFFFLQQPTTSLSLGCSLVDQWLILRSHWRHRKNTKKEHHACAFIMSDNFMKVMSNQQPSVASRLNQVLPDQISCNREKLASIIKTIVFCGRQNISLRGHRDNMTDLERDFDHSINHGNFLWMLVMFNLESTSPVVRKMPLTHLQ
jgi:hypothetical protein